MFANVRPGITGRTRQITAATGARLSQRRIFARFSAMNGAGKAMKICRSTAGSQYYPPLLNHCSDAPLVLYACGQNPAALKADIIAVVGSRSASVAGVRNAEVFARSLSQNNVVIASGMAQGIDAAAHEGAIDGGAGTIAVVGTGPDIVYPREHRKLARAFGKAE